MNLNSLIQKQRKKEVSPIQREDTNHLMNSGTDLFDSSMTHTSISNQLTNRDFQINSKSQMKIIEESEFPQTTEETKELVEDSNDIELTNNSCEETNREDFTEDVSSNTKNGRESSESNSEEN
jgi:hypothetical protein